MRFPKGFVWGAASASYQIEGAAREDGKGPSVWDMFCRKQGAVWKNQNGDVACDYYHRWKEDVSLMKEIGLKGYRFSISWTRVLPEGVGQVNAKGLDFYDRLVDGLLAAKVQPWATLFHWDYPYRLYCRGGWLNSASSDWFAEYTALVVDRLSDRVKHWMTLNEPQCFVGLGHSSGIHAPGDKLGFAEILRIAHNVLLAHGKAVKAIRARSKEEPRIGYAPVGVVSIPASRSMRDIRAAHEAMFRIVGKEIWNNTWWLEPVLKGKYPEDGLKLFEAEMPPIRAGDMETMHQPLDFFGVNIYLGQTVRAGKDGRPETVPPPLGHALTAYRWAVTPDSLYWGPKFYWERYKLPLVVTENGMSGADWISLDGKVHDPQRIDFLQRYLLSLRGAIADGVDVRGYFQWSLTDNFEWAEGVKERFGLIFLDYATQKRILKDSALWYRKVIAGNGACLERS